MLLLVVLAANGLAFAMLSSDASPKDKILNRSEWTMAIEKKSLISTLKTTKKANIVKGEAATTSPAVMSPNIKHPNVKHPNVKHPNVKHPNVKHPNVKHPVVKM
jgi:hypothetical protein